LGASWAIQLRGSPIQPDGKEPCGTAGGIEVIGMKKRTYFDKYDGPGWPSPSDLEPFFLAPPGKEWSYLGGNENWGLIAEGLYGTEDLEPYKDRVDLWLKMWGHPQHGVLLIYQKYGGGHSDAFTSKGDLNRLREIVRMRQGDPMPIGLFIPFAEAWKAVKEFIETEGELPKSIEWVRNRDLPPNTFSDP
jgi:Immunity protein Imm1